MLYLIQSIFYRESEISATEIINELRAFINFLPAWEEKPKEWIITHPKEKIIAIDKMGVSNSAVEYVTAIMAKRKNISISLASKDGDDSPLIIWLKNTPAVSENRFSLTLAIRSPNKKNDKSTFIKILEKMHSLSAWKYKYILIETEQYKMEQRSFFEDRLPVGWMLYLPIIIDPKEIPSALQVINTLENPSTIIITNNTFDGKNANDILSANNIEIELAAHGYLPKWTEL